ncbi:hypothetical protein BDZ97DRAFT_1165931 [Flammula alnicola]|nr:hypothetical protein BDZ97DRAFT_1165931 [Flammula alnicola]
MILSDLHALLHIPESEATVERVRILHASFPDFLLDQSRSGRFFIDVAKAHTNLARRWLRYCGTISLISSRPEIISILVRIIILVNRKSVTVILLLVDLEPPAMLRSARINEAIFRHCRHANLSAELQVDLYNFEVDSTLSITGSDKEEMWLHLGVILDFIAWLEYQIFPDPGKDVHHHLLLCMQNMFRRTFHSTRRTFSIIYWWLSHFHHLFWTGELLLSFPG